MTWYAIRTEPGAQMPQREYIVEKPSLINPDSKGFGRKGYRIVPSLNAKESAVERALSDAGFVHYMPAEFKVIRDRKKAGTYCLRRYPLLPGYVFVTSCAGIRDVPGVSSIVGARDGETPLAINIMDILALRTIEARGQAEADRELSARISQTHSEAKKIRDKAAATARRKLNPGTEVKILWGDAVGRDATVAGWEDGTRLRAILTGLENAGEVVLVSYDEVRLVA